VDQARKERSTPHVGQLPALVKSEEEESLGAKKLKKEERKNEIIKRNINENYSRRVGTRD